MPKGQASADKQVQSIIKFAEVCQMYQDNIDNIKNKVNTISEYIDMSLKELEFKNYDSVKGRLNYIKSIIGDSK